MTKLHWNDSVTWNDTLRDNRKMDPNTLFQLLEIWQKYQFYLKTWKYRMPVQKSRVKILLNVYWPWIKVHFSTVTKNVISPVSLFCFLKDKGKVYYIHMPPYYFQLSFTSTANLFTVSVTQFYYLVVWTEILHHFFYFVPRMMTKVVLISWGFTLSAASNWNLRPKLFLSKQFLNHFKNN